MKKLLGIIAVAMLMVVGAQAQVVFYESFNFTTTDLGTQSGWTNVNSGDTVGTVSGNLSVSGLAASTGNRVAFDAAGIDPHRTYTAINSGTVWFSFAFQVSGLGSLNATGGYFAGLGANTSLFSSTIWTRSDGAGFDIGVSNNTAVPGTNWTAGTTAINTTQFVVGNFDLAADTSAFWINPSSSDFGTVSAPTATFSGLSGTTRTTLDRFFIRQDGTTATPFVQLDELRVGQDWASVTPIPEPSTYALLGLGLGALWFLRRKKLSAKA